MKSYHDVFGIKMEGFCFLNRMGGIFNEGFNGTNKGLKLIS